MNRLPNGLLTALRASRPAPRSAFGAGIPPGSAGHVKKPDLLRMRPVELKCIFARFELLSFAPGASFFWQRESWNNRAASEIKSAGGLFEAQETVSWSIKKYSTI